MMTSTFLISVSNKKAKLPDRCEDCNNLFTDIFLGHKVCKIHLMARELAEGF